MKTSVQYVMIGSLSLLVLAVLSAHLLRAVIAARFLDDKQFEEFQENGLAHSVAALPPGKMRWEYQFLLSVLDQSEQPLAKKFAFAWKWICRGYLFFAFAFLVAAMLTPFVG